MVERVRRNRSTPTDTAGIEAEMKLIAMLQDRIAADTASLATRTASLYGLMKSKKLTVHAHPNAPLVAELVRSKGRVTNVIDPKGFRKLVPDDKDFFSAITVSVTNAKKILAEKQLAPITTQKPGKLGEETVQVRRST